MPYNVCIGGRVRQTGRGGRAGGGAPGTVGRASALGRAAPVAPPWGEAADRKRRGGQGLRPTCQRDLRQLQGIQPVEDHAMPRKPGDQSRDVLRTTRREPTEMRLGERGLPRLLFVVRSRSPPLGDVPRTRDQRGVGLRAPINAVGHTDPPQRTTPGGRRRHRRRSRARALDAVDEPLPAVGVVAPGARVASAEEGALHAARHEVAGGSRRRRRGRRAVVLGWPWGVVAIVPGVSMDERPPGLPWDIRSPSSWARREAARAK